MGLSKLVYKAWYVLDLADNRPLFNHSIRVMASVLEDDEAMTVALLHDMVEEGEVGLSYLRGHFPEAVVEAVDAISRREGERYFDYIKRVKANPLARRVKLADLDDNLRGRPTKPSPSLEKRYLRAEKILKGEK